MKPFKDLSIRNKLIAIILVITALPLGAGFAFVAANQVRTFKKDMVTSTVLIARVIADYSVSDLAFGDRGESEKTLERLKTVPNIQFASLYDAKGQLFATYGDAAKKDPRPPGDTFAPEFRAGALHVTQPIIYKGERYGVIHLCASTEDLDRSITAYLLAMALGLVVLSGITFFLAVRLQSLISGPILNLSGTARRISQDHDYSLRVDKTGDDELGVLCDGFNEMLTAIHVRELERDKADRRTREKSQFLANMSHELRTPLNSIIGFSEVLLGRLAEKVTAKELKFLQNINNSGHHLLGIINDILDLSKVEAGMMEVHPSFFSLRGLVDGVCQVMKAVSAKRNVGLVVEVADDLPTVEADPVKVKQILYNLLSNAVKFSPYNAAVTIKARFLGGAESPLGEDSIEIVVIDQGPGIDPKDHELIFKEFRQTEGGAAQIEGTGLGLALVKRFVEMHRGHVAVTSGLGRGTSFTLVIPRQFRHADAAPDQRKRILVVQEDAGGYEAVCRQLASGGYLPVWARSVEETLALARASRPAAIALDLSLRGTDGLLVLKSLKADPDTRSIPVIIVSVMDNRELGPVLGAADYFPRPVDQEHFVTRLKSLTRQSGVAPRLLVIDDEVQVHEMLTAWLEPHGYTLLHAHTGSEGVEKAVATTPDVILLDLMMADMDGFEVAVRLKSEARTARIPVIVLTAKDLTEKDRWLLRGKISAFVQKGPATEARLVSAIEALVHPAEVTVSGK